MKTQCVDALIPMNERKNAKQVNDRLSNGNLSLQAC